MSNNSLQHTIHIIAEHGKGRAQDLALRCYGPNRERAIRFLIEHCRAISSEWLEMIENDLNPYRRLNQEALQIAYFEAIETKRRTDEMFNRPGNDPVGAYRKQKDRERIRDIEREIASRIGG